jgi:hypothetical protein
MSLLRKMIRKTFFLALSLVFSLQAALIALFTLSGRIDINLGFSRLVVEDMENSVIISILCALAMVGASVRWKRSHLVNGAMTLFSTGFTFLAAELTLAHFFPVAYENPVYTFNKAASNPISARGPVTKELKQPGEIRILAQGDSILWGAGVTQWTDLVSYRLLNLLVSKGIPATIHTLAQPGAEIDWHALKLAEYGRGIDPDIILYLWYINDLEVVKNRPPYYATPWSDLKYFKAMRRASNLVFYADALLAKYLAPAKNDYSSYMLRQFEPDTEPWSVFRDNFHEWITRANAITDRVIVAFYPSLPPSGDASPYIYRRINAKVASLAKPHEYFIPAYRFEHNIGHLINGASSRSGRVLMANERTGATGYLAYGPYKPLGAGSFEISFRVMSRGASKGAAMTLDVVSQGGTITHAKTILNATETPDGKWVVKTLKVDIGSMVEDMEFRVFCHGAGDCLFDGVSMPVWYKFEVVDLFPALEGKRTWATLLDAHPNSATHGIMTKIFYERISAMLDARPVKTRLQLGIYDAPPSASAKTAALP